MRPICHTKTQGLSGAPLFGPKVNYMHVSTREGLTYKCSDRRAGLAVLHCGEGVPADAGSCPAKDPARRGDPFDLAAVLCGHDPLTSTGAADARRDYRVWDLAEQIEATR